eukprot:TRINITY_DN3075_c0_g1_i1.p1 TRINITY_DN3075_c0_g1~~TRINITY_DN3075_c0_g1_i1.p1  ORF type:complete len:278 (-),score=68.55 TRINITY_DN3075_c0_g1_i1:86-919(-)
MEQAMIFLPSSSSSSSSSKTSDEKSTSLSLCESSGQVNERSVLRQLKLEEENVKLMYVYGSRMWGSGTEASDWDFVIVRKVDKNEHKSGNTHVGQIDACVLPEDEFEEKVRNHAILYLLPALQLLPPSAVWKNTLFSNSKSNGLTFRLNTLYETQHADAIRDFEMATKMIGKQKEDKGVKTLRHCHRAYLLCCFVASHKSRLSQSALTVDFAIINQSLRLAHDHITRLASQKSSSGAVSWTQFLTIYKSLLKKLDTKLASICHTRQLKNASASNSKQ